MLDSQKICLPPIFGRTIGIVGDFRNILVRLRRQRGLTQVELAARTGIAPGSIARGESADRCPWRKSTVIDVMTALHAVAPVSDEDAAAYFTAAGMSPDLLATAKAAAAQAREDARMHARGESGSPTDTRRPITDDELVHIWAQTISDRIGSQNMLTALQAMASASGTTLPPRQGSAAPSMRYMRIDASEPGLRADLYIPLNPPPAKPQATRVRPA